jgi:hypothetical protein
MGAQELSSRISGLEGRSAQGVQSGEDYGSTCQAFVVTAFSRLGVPYHKIALPDALALSFQAPAQHDRWLGGRSTRHEEKRFSEEEIIAILQWRCECP